MALCASNAAGECVSATFEQAAKVYPIVLAGRAVSSRDHFPGDRGAFSETIFQVERVWKGSPPKHVSLYQPFTHDRIDFTGVVGVEYVVFARPLTSEERARYSVASEVDAFHVDYCVSKPAIKGDLASLGKSYPPPK